MGNWRIRRWTAADNSYTGGLCLAIPSELKYVSPTVHTGWTIDIKKSSGTVTEISWTGGQIPADQRDDFSFSPQSPAKAGELDWKAYQTYSDGTTQAWDQEPSTSKNDVDVTKAGSYSVTKIVDDLTPASNATPTAAASTNSSSTTDTLTLGTASVAIIISVIALIKHGKASPNTDNSRLTQ